jgi:Superinfection immunity protein
MYLHLLILQQRPGLFGLLLMCCGGILGLAFYFLPSIIAFSRRHRNSVAIFVLNLFLGWTLVGWVVSLVWSFTSGR